jgi:hypothetical protein
MTKRTRRNHTPAFKATRLAQRAWMALRLRLKSLRLALYHNFLLKFHEPRTFAISRRP